MKLENKYLKHWLDYCYYRSVDFFTLPSDENPNYFWGTTPLGWMIASYILIVLICLGFDNKWIFAIFAIAINSVLDFFFNETTYHKAEALFKNESKRNRIICGFLVYLTCYGPLIICIALLVILDPAY